MRARVYSNGGNSTGGFTFNGGQLIGALILAGNPSELLEAASKQYVDSSLVNLSASNLTTGTLPSGRLPSFTGDIVKPAGSSTINLAPVGITAGDYVKPTVDSKGRVIAGGVLTADDITNLSWDKITADKPITLAGYGINDAVGFSGATLTGFLTFNGTVTNDMQAATKQYVDATLSSSSGIAIGDVIRKPYATTPSGFLKCNGAEVSKTTYSSLYAVIGDRFNKQKQFTAGRPWQQQYNINETQIDELGVWTSETALPVNLAYSTVIVTKNRVYFLGGCTASGVIVSTVYTAIINNDGSLGSWTTGTSLPVVTYYSSSIIINNKVYLIGGYDGTNLYSSVYVAPINANGTLGTWSLHNSMPGSLCMTQVMVTKNKIYVLGGWNATTISTVYTATINSDGTIGTWSTGTSLPIPLTHTHLVIIKNYVYLLGGYNGSNYLNTIYRSIINTDGSLGAWNLYNSNLPTVFDYGQVYVTKYTLYIIGGTNGSNSVTTIYTAAINADGSIGTWGTSTPLPTGLSASQLIATKNRLYLMGGWLTNTVLSCSISGGLNDYSPYYSDDITNYMTPGSGKPWQQQYEINTSQSLDIIGWAATTALPINISASAYISTKNRVYLLGGSIDNSAYTNIVYTAPVNSDGTLGTWVTGTSLPGVLGYSQAIITKNRVYLLGGKTSTSVNVSTVYTAPINADGTLGTWATGISLPSDLSSSQSVITKNRVYLFCGGTNSGFVSTVYTAPINADGTLGSWSTGTSLPSILAGSTAIVTKNRIYLCGGYNGSTWVSTSYTATINSDGLIGTWTNSTSLPSNLSGGVSFITNNKAYIIGGFTGVSVSSTVYTAPINSDGVLGSWTTGTSLNSVTSSASLFITKNHIYICGGNGAATTPINSIFMASILGGENDYSSYYDGTITPAVVIDPSTTFALPDLSQGEKFDTVSYIKY